LADAGRMKIENWLCWGGIYNLPAIRIRIL